MRSKTYRAKTMRDALTRVRRDLGGDAVILATREVQRRRPFGLGGRALVEVVAADHMPEEDASGRRHAPADRPEQAAPPSSGTPPAAFGPSPALRARFGDELGRLHAMVEALSRQGRIDHLLPELPGPLVSVYARLVEADVPEALARRLASHLAETLEPDQLGRPDSVTAALCRAVAQCVPVAPPIRPIAGARRVVALVGPTGVGKTTTVAKLAANFKLVQGARVGLITVDTYRIAAVEQLRTYAEIIDLPLGVVNDPADMAAALDGLGAVDLVFIDTAGRGPRDEVKVRELAAFLERARPDEVHLVLSAAAGERGMRAALDRFAVVGVDRIVLSKLDEAESLGGTLGLIGPTQRPFSYLTTGQAVPDDIEPADRGRIARLVLNLDELT